MGFTLVELMITVAVLAVIAAIAAPSMTGLLNSNRLNGQANEMVSGLQLARSEAIRRNAPVLVCASNDGATCANSGAWDRWIVLGQANATDAAEVIRDTSAGSLTQISGPRTGIRFAPSGMLPAQAVVTVCIPTDNPSLNQRAVTVAVGGGTRVDRANGGGTCP